MTISYINRLYGDLNHNKNNQYQASNPYSTPAGLDGERGRVGGGIAGTCVLTSPPNIPHLSRIFTPRNM